MSFQPIAPEALAQLFTEARTYKSFEDEPVSNELLQQIYDLMKWAPTASNGNPLRLQFVKSTAAKEKLVSCIWELNRDRVLQAPVTAILAYDEAWLDHIQRLVPYTDLRPFYEHNPPSIQEAAVRNSSLQGAYFMLAARALGLDCLPMSGFDNDKVDEAFFKDTTWKSNFLCSIGRGDRASLFPRLPRFDFTEICQIS